MDVNLGTCSLDFLEARGSLGSLEEEMGEVRSDRAGGIQSGARRSAADGLVHPVTMEPRKKYLRLAASEVGEAREEAESVT